MQHSGCLYLYFLTRLPTREVVKPYVWSEVNFSWLDVTSSLNLNCLATRVLQSTLIDGVCAGDPSVYTFSMHCGDQTFPTVVQQSDWDIALPASTQDEEYLKVCGVRGG